ncbi:MAG: hypothetical protein KA764_03285 [Anaerolineales bacterium]|nr:hypothetical protein [Anaerolineales bacterium]
MIPTEPQLRRPLPAILWNALTGVTLASTLCACGLITLVFFNPQSSLNPFPPPTRTPWAGALPTEPVGALGAPTLPPTWTATPPGWVGATPTAAATVDLSLATATPVTLAPLAPTTAAPAAATPTLAGTATQTERAIPATPTATPEASGYEGPIATLPPSGYP